MIPYTYLNDYPPEEQAASDALINSCIEHLPYTLATPVMQICRHVRESNYGRAMNYMLDFFEISTQYLSCLLYATIQKKYKGSGTLCAALHPIINKIDLKRPLSFGDWLNDIFNPLVAIAAKEIPDNPLLVSIRNAIFVRKNNILLGDKRNPSVVQIRNEYKGHSTTLSEELYRGVVYTLEPRMLTMLKAILPLAEWNYFTPNDDGRLVVLNGTDCQTIEAPAALSGLQRHHYYISYSPITTSTEDELLDVFPLIFCNESNYVYVFQSLKDEEMAFISSNENAVTFISERWNDALDAYFQQSLPAFDVAKAMNWDEMKGMMAAEAGTFLGRVYREKKYNQELFVDQKRLSAFLRDFLASGQTLFPMLGEAGQGKTNQLCYWTENLVKAGKGVLIFSSAAFSEVTLEQKLKSIFRVSPRKPVKKLLDDLHQKAAENGELVYFFFDAVNECLTYCQAPEGSEGPLELYNDIRRLLVKEEYAHFKVLFTCRSYTWKNLLQKHVPTDDSLTFNSGNEEDTAVRGFTDDELKEAYAIYRELYQMNTPFKELRRSVVIRLRDPLVLKMSCTNYLDAELPTDMLPYTSLELFDKMFKDIGRSYAGNKQCAIIREMAGILLEKYEQGTPADSISEEELQRAYSDESHPMHAMASMVYKKDGITVAYAELLNKPERPVLRLVESEKAGHKGSIQFIYERFMEYAMSRVLVEKEISRMTDAEANISAETFVEWLHRGAVNVVFIGVLRNALIMDLLRTGRQTTILQLASTHSADYEVMLLLTETLNVLIRENYEREAFSLLRRLIKEQIPGGEAMIREFNSVNKKIESNKADDEVIRAHGRLYKSLSPILRLRKLASVSTFNGILLTDYFNEGLYKEDPYDLLWKLMTDPINEVRNDACLYAYYLSNKTHTMAYTPLRENISEMIVKEMYRIIKETGLLKNIGSARIRRRTMLFMETATRITVLLIIDALLSSKEGNRDRVQELLSEMVSIFSYMTGNFYLVRIMMPFFQIIMRRQITFQSIYVNNAIEYQTFWDESIVPRHGGAGEWSHETYKSVLPYIFHYCYQQKEDNDSKRVETGQFEKLHPLILSAYKTGDSFSYFALERILVIVGRSDWQLVRPVIMKFFTDEYRTSPWFDYSQMSILYVLFQLMVHWPESNPEVIDIYARECADWTRRCRGLFKAHNSHKANPTQLYKRNVMNWYCVVYCRHLGDNVPHGQDETCVPVFYSLLDEALRDTDKELLYHLVENISELITDFGYIQTALQLLKYILVRLDSKEKVEMFDRIQLQRGDIYQEPLVTLIGKVLGTAKNYFSAEVDSFIKKDIIGLSFPGVSKYREEILGYNPSGETLSDLLTHKFGNFLMWSLLNEEAVDKFAFEAMTAAPQAKSCFQWFDQVVRILFKHLFKVKL